MTTIPAGYTPGTEHDIRTAQERLSARREHAGTDLALLLKRHIDRLNSGLTFRTEFIGHVQQAVGNYFAAVAQATIDYNTQVQQATDRERAKQLIEAGVARNLSDAMTQIRRARANDQARLVDDQT